MNNLNDYDGRFVFLYTVKGFKLLCKMLHADEANKKYYIIDIIQTEGNYSTGIVKLAKHEIGYVVDLPEEIQQGIKLTIDSVPKLNEFFNSEAAEKFASKVDFGYTNKRLD